jgi:hypothetical protein
MTEPIPSPPNERPPPAGNRVAASGPALRLTLLSWSLALMARALIGIGVFCVWLTGVVLAPFTIGIPLTLIGIAASRWLADRQRRWASRVLGAPIRSPYRPRPPAGNWLRRARHELADRATWRDAWWLLLNGIVGFFLECLSLSLLLGGVFYLIYPFLYAVTPPDVFRTPFGFFTLHTVGQAALLIPLGVWLIGLWYACAPGLARADARLARALLH